MLVLRMVEIAQTERAYYTDRYTEAVGAVYREQLLTRITAINEQITNLLFLLPIP